jgi:hypothetical protein
MLVRPVATDKRAFYLLNTTDSGPQVESRRQASIYGIYAFLSLVFFLKNRLKEAKTLSFFWLSTN